MNYRMGVKISNSLTNLPHNICYFLFRKIFPLDSRLVDQPSHPYLQDDINTGKIIKEPIHFDDVGVIHKQLYFELSDKLLSNFLFL